MEYTNHSFEGGRPLFSFRWDVTTERFNHYLSIVWQGNIFSVSVQSSRRGFFTGRVSEFTIRFNQETYELNFFDAQHFRGLRGKLPDLK